MIQFMHKNSSDIFQTENQFQYDSRKSWSDLVSNGIVWSTRSSSMNDHGAYEFYCLSQLGVNGFVVQSTFFKCNEYDEVFHMLRDAQLCGGMFSKRESLSDD